MSYKVKTTALTLLPILINTNVEFSSMTPSSSDCVKTIFNWRNSIISAKKGSVD